VVESWPTHRTHSYHERVQRERIPDAGYERILFDDRNWEEAFRPVFQNKDQVRARLVVLKSYRDPVAHTRGEITPEQNGEVVGAIHWMRKMMHAQSRVDDFSEPT